MITATNKSTVNSTSIIIPLPLKSADKQKLVKLEPCINMPNERRIFHHKKGLRQGDPLSPMLFDIGADILQQMVTAAYNTLSLAISAKMPEAMVEMQYANDTAIIASSNIPTLITLSNWCLESSLRYQV